MHDIPFPSVVLSHRLSFYLIVSKGLYIMDFSKIKKLSKNFEKKYSHVERIITL